MPVYADTSSYTQGVIRQPQPEQDRMTDKELERLERIAALILAGMLAGPRPMADADAAVGLSITFSQLLVEQLDALKIPE